MRAWCLLIAAARASRVVAIAACCSAPALAQTSATFPDLEEPPMEEPAPPPPPAYPAPGAPSPDAAPAQPAPPSVETPAPAEPAPGDYLPVPETRPLDGGPLTEWPPGSPSAVPELPQEPPAAPGFMPPLLPHRAGFPVPDGYVVRHRMPVGLIVAGTLTLGTGYAVGLAARGSDRASPADRALAIPIIGPFIALAGQREAPCEIEDVDTDSIDSADDLNASKDEVQSCVNGTLDEASQLVLIAADGIVQVVGASLLVAGLAGGRQELVREDLVRKRSSGAPTARLRLQRFGQVWGLGLVGSF